MSAEIVEVFLESVTEDVADGISAQEAIRRGFVKVRPLLTDLDPKYPLLTVQQFLDLVDDDVAGVELDAEDER